MPQALSGLREALDGLDADDRRDARRLKFPPGVAEEGLHSGCVEPAADLIRSRDGEVLTSGGEDAAVFEFVLQRLALGFGALEDRIRVADCVSEGFVGQIVKAGCGRQICSLAHGSTLLV
jgi:hypothetical protein